MLPNYCTELWSTIVCRIPQIITTIIFSGKPSNEPANPDYVLSIRMSNQKRQRSPQTRSARFERQAKRRDTVERETELQEKTYAERKTCEEATEALLSMANQVPSSSNAGEKYHENTKPKL